MNKKGLAVLFLAILGITAGIATLIDQAIISNHATVEVVGNIDVYVDGELNPNSLDWGPLKPDTSYYVNLTVVSKANGDVTVYILVSGLSSGWTQEWAVNNASLEPNEVAQGDLTLYVPADASAGTYNWILTVCAEET